MTSENKDKNEWDVIHGCLPSLLKKGCLTDIEYRIIASTKSLSERKCAIYDIIMSKTNAETSKLFAVLRTSAQGVRAKEKCVLQNPNYTKESDLTFSLTTNPLLNSTVIKNIYAFLSLEDIKKYRLVCRVWNSTAEICLRKRSLIHFRPTVLEPSSFLEIFKYSLPNLPYTAFKFSSEDLSWSIAEIEEFFHKYGKNIKEMRLEGIILRKDSEMFLPNYDVSRWFIKCSDIAILKIDTSQNNNATLLNISLNQLAPIKNITLRSCGINIGCDLEEYRMAPNSISFMDVNIRIRGHIDRHAYHYDGLIDFSQTESAVLLSSDNGAFGGVPKLDMQSQVFNANRLHLVNVEIENWAEAKGKVQFLHLHGFDVVEKTQLKIKELTVLGKHIIDLSVLPKTIEKLRLLENNQIICTSVPHELPNIKHLLFDVVDNNSHLLNYFNNCPNLAELELSVSEDGGNFHLSCIPKTVKKVKLNCVHLKFADYSILELDKLILNDSKHLSRYKNFANILTKIKAKVLVVVVTKKTQLSATDLMGLVEAYNDQSEKIIIGSSNDADLLNESDFEGSVFSGCVDTKSNYYLFENNVGKAIAKMQFDLFKT